MLAKSANLTGLIILEPKVFEDKRGYLFESYNKNEMDNFGISLEFVQDNQSSSEQNVLRGLHFQRPPFTQAKLIRVLSGKIYDVSVDLRKDSPSYKKWFGIELSAENKLQLFIPRGLAHGFVVLSKQAEIFYKCDNFYKPQSEAGIRFDDNELKIDWKVRAENLILSEKDLKLPYLKELQLPFSFFQV